MSIKIVHMGGIGNQMASYTTLIAARELNPDDEFYLENLIYDVADANSYCNQWNGYELDKVFEICCLNVRKQILWDIESVRVIIIILPALLNLCNPNFCRRRLVSM